MDLSLHSRLAWALVIPAVGSIAIMLSGKRPNVREGISLTTALLLFACVASVMPAVRAGEVLKLPLATILPGLEIALRADALSMIFAFPASFLWIVTVFYAAGYMRGLKEHAQTRFAACFALALFGAIGCAFSDNLLTLYLFYEVVSISTYPLVAHHQDAEGYEGGKKYLVYLTTTAKALVLPAMAVLYAINGNLDFAANAHDGVMASTVHAGVTTVIYACLILGFAKNGVMPFHHWLPGAMVAPTPVSALLHAVAVVKVGVFSTVRVMLYVFGTKTMADLHLGMPTAYFVSFTILAASLIALAQDNLKARLAYSTVSQLSYVVLGVALLTPNGMTGGLLHIANHAFSKITLFFCAGAIYVATHKKDISSMRGLGRVMPWTFGAFAIASLSMIGVPGVAGFMTKWNLLLGAWDAASMGIIAILLTSTLLNAAYFAPVTYRAFFDKPDAPQPEGIREAPLSMLIPLLITAAISVGIGIWPDFFLTLTNGVIK